VEGFLFAGSDVVSPRRPLGILKHAYPPPLFLCSLAGREDTSRVGWPYGIDTNEPPGETAVGHVTQPEGKKKRKGACVEDNDWP
jgi:hypothetical protein